MIQQDISIYLSFKSTYLPSLDQEQNSSNASNITLIVSETEPNEILSISTDQTNPSTNTKKFSIRKSNRKVRTTITKEKLELINKAFTQYSAHQTDPNPIFSLKKIAQQLGFSYSTILHKFREFRINKKVKGGALIASLQKKRKYRKSLQIEHIIEKALTQRSFRKIVELSKYILCKFERSYSRSTISRHLGQMGCSLKSFNSSYLENSNRPNYKQQRQTQIQSLAPMIQDEKDTNVTQIDEMACPLSNFIRRINIDGILECEAIKKNQNVSALVAARCQQQFN